MRRLATLRFFTFRSVLTLLLMSLFTALAFSQQNNDVRVVRLSYIDGTVQLLDGNGVAFDQAYANMPVTEGMRLKTADNGRVEVQFEDGSVARVTPNSTISFDQLRRTGEGETITLISAESGLTYYEFNNRTGKYTVRFGPYSLTAPKSSIFRVDVDQNPAQVAVMRGTVHVDTGNDGGIDVPTNQTATLDMKDPSSYDVAQSIASDTWDQWNSDRDQMLERMGAKATMARALGGNPDDPSWSDLDYYGDWYDVPGYGAGWMPAGVAAGWDPFASGYWGYYPAYGYTWISGYAWGWMPYHCGAWNWFAGPGWMWFPGNCGWGAFGTGWYPVATVWNCPPNYVPPSQPKYVVPVHGPVHMPPARALIAVNRGSENLPVVVEEGRKPVATPIKFQGKTIQPMEASVQPRVAGPLGESFTVSSGYLPGTRSGWALEGARGVYQTAPSTPGSLPVETVRGTLGMPRSTRMPAPQSYHSEPGFGASPHYYAPSAPSMPSAPHMSAPPPPPSAPSSGGGRPH